MNLLAHTQEQSPFEAAVEASIEIGAYEYLWLEKGASFKKIADRFRNDPNALPSDFVTRANAQECFDKVIRKIRESGLDRINVRLNNTLDYPERLREARNPLELMYFLGNWGFVETPSVAIVGSRKASEYGKERAARLARELVGKGYTVVSGLAEGIDTAALTEAIRCEGRTIGVIGTPICDYYPKKNKELQDKIASEHLLISQVPILKYHSQDYRLNRSFFPERNATMSALTKATIIVEAGETSGTLTQARAALFQNRKLFILNSCFERSDIIWPARFEKKGAIRVRTMDDIWGNL